MNHFLAGNTNPELHQYRLICMCVYNLILSISVQIPLLLFSEEVSTWYLQPVP